MHKADLKHNSNRLQQKLEAIYRLRRTKTKVNWDNAGYVALLEKLGNPHLRLPPVIHVAGTNGKGSVIAFLRSMLEADGKRVHVYTSPHLIKVNERIVLGGVQIDDDKLEALIDEVMALNDDVPLSFFEIMTAVAFKAFSEYLADVLLLEVGMGGRLDCTNIVPYPLVSVINRISLDHTEFLGETIAEVANEKAGIMKDGVPCVIGYQGEGTQKDEIYTVLHGAAKNKNITTCFYNENFIVAQHENHLDLQVNAAQYVLPHPKMTGKHQVYNAALAVATLHMVKDKLYVSDAAIKDGVLKAQWAGRLQNIKTKFNNDIWLDSGHNDSAGEVLAVQLQQWQEHNEKDLHLIIGMLGTKDFMNFLKPILPYTKNVHVVPIAFDPAGSRSFDDFKNAIMRENPQIIVDFHDNAVLAVGDIAQVNSSARILIAGSVYLAGEVLENFGE